MARVYLVSPSYENVYKRIDSKNSGVRQPPLGLAYIASFLKNRGHSIKLFDASFSRDAIYDIKQHICEFQPDFIGITSTTPQIANAFLIAEFIKSISSAAKVIIGGPHVSALPKEAVLKGGIDLVVCGEGEITISEIVEGKPLEEIKGICYLKNGEIKINFPRPLIEDLDSIPFPLWEQLPVSEYYYFPERAIGVISGRGCPYKCTFCASEIVHRNRYRTRTPLNFVEEIEWIYNKFGIKYFFFVDETFTIKQDRVEEICSLIIKRNLPIKWTCDTRVNHLTVKMMKSMKAAGCDTLRIGIESADKTVLDATRKNISLEQVEKAVSWANDLKMKIVGFFILGLPYETPESIKRTLKFSKKLNLSLAHFTMLVPLPGTPIWDMTKEGSILRCTASDWSDFTRYDKAIVESDTLSCDQLCRLHGKILRSYYCDPYFIGRRIIGMRTFKQLIMSIKGAMKVFKMAFLKS